MFDTRLLEESGKVIESDSGHEGLMPVNQSDYNQMLIEARDPYITKEMLNNRDVVGQQVVDGPNEGKMAISDDQLSGSNPLPTKYDYIARSEVSGDDKPGDATVILGPNEGSSVIDEEDWESMDEGRAELYVPETELTDYDLEEGTGDLCLPEPTSDRDRLQSHDKFWKYLGQQFAEQFDSKVDEVYALIEQSDGDALDAIMELEPEELVVSPDGFSQ